MTEKTSIKLVKKDTEYMKKAIDEIKETLNKNEERFVSKMEFALTNRQQDAKLSSLEKLIYGTAFSALGLVLKTALEIITKQVSAK